MKTKNYEFKDCTQNVEKNGFETFPLSKSYDELSTEQEAFLKEKFKMVMNLLQREIDLDSNWGISDIGKEYVKTNHPNAPEIGFPSLFLYIDTALYRGKLSIVYNIFFNLFDIYIYSKDQIMRKKIYADLHWQLLVKSIDSFVNKPSPGTDLDTGEEKLLYMRNTLIYAVQPVQPEDLKDFLEENPRYRPIVEQDCVYYVSEDVEDYLDYEVDLECSMCGKEHSQKVIYFDLYSKASNDMLIQNCFPYLSKVEREAIKTGTCPDCQKKLFGICY